MEKDPFYSRTHNVPLDERCKVMVLASRGMYFELKYDLSRRLARRCSRRAGPDGLCWQHRQWKAKQEAAKT